MSQNYTEKYLDALAQLIALPSVSAQQRALAETAAAVGKLFEELNGDVTIDATFGAPFVYARFNSARPDAKTLVIYNHYDVQPAEPLELWQSDPFTLTKKAGLLIGRGVSDDKGHLTARLTALAKYLAAHDNQLPVNIVFLAEGMEENASVGLDKYLTKYAPEIDNVDLVIWESGDGNARGQREIFGGNKGIITFNLSVRSADVDLHSSYAAVVDSATWRLLAAINSLRDAKGKILIDGIYDDVIRPNTRELTLSKDAEITPDVLQERAGLRLPFLEVDGFTHDLFFNPTINVEGIESGYTGQGVKTILPALATAKLEIRLVPGMDPDKTFQQVVAHLHKHGFDDVVAELTLGEPGYRSDMSAEPILKLADIAAKIYGGADQISLQPTSPGTGPMYYVNHALNAPIASIGLSHPGSLDHAPNENVRLSDYLQHITVIEKLIESYED